MMPYKFQGKITLILYFDPNQITNYEWGQSENSFGFVIIHKFITDTTTLRKVIEKWKNVYMKKKNKQSKLVGIIQKYNKRESRMMDTMEKAWKFLVQIQMEKFSRCLQEEN